MQGQSGKDRAPLYDLIVIGGGPAGMMAAGRAAERGKTVLLLEKNENLGKKLLISATGRCNVTNSAPAHVFLEAYGKAGNFIRTALATFDNERLRQFLAERGVATVEERKGRIFPESQRADSVLNALISYMSETGVMINCGVKAVRLKCSDRKMAGVETNTGDFSCRNCLIATGGLSYPSTGSTGDGYRMASEVGHHITPTYPSIVAFETAERWVTSLQGFPLKNVKIKAFQKGIVIPSVPPLIKGGEGGLGEALFTHYGISGPTVLDVSKKIVESLPNGSIVLSIDLKPYSALDELDRNLLYHLKKQGGKKIKNALDGFLSPRLVPALLNISEIDENEKASQVGKSERRRFVKLLKDLRLTITRHRPIEEAMVTAGGISLDEVEPKTMQSKLVEGLYFAGEALDVDGPTGGFNLQAAFSTGYLAGESVC